MKLLLCAVNAKFIHTNLAVYNLEASGRGHGVELELAEYTINNRIEEMLKEIYRKKADIIAFSCYIWNVEMIYDLSKELKKVLPDTKIWLGGPEVSYDADRVLAKHPEIDLVVQGEGEVTFRELCEFYGGERFTSLRDIAGICFREDDQIYANVPRRPMDMDDIPFVYYDMDRFKNKILYYETTRGCPFACSYCLSSIGEKVRFRSLDLVKKELQFFLDQKVPQVKFVDRTFNCRRSHSTEIWNYLIEHDNQVTNFHFEIAADLLTDADIEIFKKMRPGLIQLEIGVQSTHDATIHEIRRVMDLEKLADIVAKVKALGNIHQHLDLIAGLPYEDYETFKQSFNDVFLMKPDQLQLGFLKVLKGSYMHEKRFDYEIHYTDKAPYEVLYTRWITYDEILKLKELEEMVELYYNSDQFTKTLPYVMEFAKDPFTFFRDLAIYYFKRTGIGVKRTRLFYYELLREFMADQYPAADGRIVEQLLMYDLYLRENIKKRPAWTPTFALEKKEATAFFKAETTAKYFPEMEEYNSKVSAGNAHVEQFAIDVDTYEDRCWWAVFNYHNRNPLTGDARVYEVEEDEESFGGRTKR